MKTPSLLAGLFLVCTASASAAPAAAKFDLTTGTPKNKEEMVYSKDKLTVKAGQKVIVNFKNGSSSKGMMHNFVVTQIGKSQDVITAALSASQGGGPDNGWFAKTADVIAGTKVIDAGEKTTVEFTAPATAGDYPFICTFPGHASMKGTLKVTK